MRPHSLFWDGIGWADERCGCRYHPDDDNGTHGGAPHVHHCAAHTPGVPAAVVRLRGRMAASKSLWRHRRKLQGKRHRERMDVRMAWLRSAKAKRHELYVALKRAESEAQMYREARDVERAKLAEIATAVSDSILAAIRKFRAMSDEERYVLAQLAEHLETLIENDALE